MRYNLKHLLLAIVVAALVAQTALPVLAQNPTGGITGTVADEQGAVIAKADITITSKATGEIRKLTSNDVGIYKAETLLPGLYEVRVEMQGFSTQIQTLTVEVGSTTTSNFSLRVGNSKEIVDIVSEAPIIDKTDFKIDGVIGRQKIDALPLNGRNFLQLALLEPGVSVNVSSPGSANNLFNVSIGGSDGTHTRLTVDGGSIVDPVTGGAAQNFSTETVQEFQISTFNFDLSTGITGFGAVNIVSRTGTNDYHGSAFMFFRDHSLSAIPSLVHDPNNPDPFFRRYQYGGSVGGPIKKDRAFFFANFERLDQTSAIGSFVTGPAIFSQFNSVTSSPYKGILANGRVDVKLTDKHSLFGRYSHDNNAVFAPDTDNTLPSDWRDNSSADDNVQFGLTSILTQNLVNDLRFNFQRITNEESIPTASECPASNPGCIGLGGPQIRVINSNLQLGNSINAFQNRDLHRYQTTDNLSWQRGKHRLNFGGEVEHNYGTGAWAFLNPGLVALFDPATVLGVNALTASTINGIPTFPAALKQQIIAALNIPVPSVFLTGGKITTADLLGLPVAQAFFGLGDPSQPPPFQTDIARNSNRVRAYAQDTWQIKPGVSLRYGLSWQFESNLENFDLSRPPLVDAIAGNKDPKRDYKEFAPSLGFAWDVGNKGKTVIRGGFGMYYDTVLFVTRLTERAIIGPAGNGRSSLTGDFFGNTIPFTQLNLPGPLAIFNLINPAIGTRIDFTTIPTKFTGANFLTILAQQSPGLLASLSAAGAAGFTGIDVLKTGSGLLDPNLRVPYSLDYSFGVQHQLPHNMAVSADFVLRRALHGLVEYDANFFKRSSATGGPIVPACVGAAAANPAALCTNGPVQTIASIDRNEYKALLVKVEKRFSNRFQFTASYALSSLVGFFETQNTTNLFGTTGDLGADARHRLTFSGVVDIPKGFQASIIATFASKPPFNALLPSTIDINGDGNNGGMNAETLPGLATNSLNRGTSAKNLFNLVNQFNANFAGKTDGQGAIIPALALPTHFSFGKNFQSEDIRFTKTFRIREKVNVQAFAEVFNLFNIANLGGFTSTLDKAGSANFNFGQPTTRLGGNNFGTGGPRSIELGARFNF